MKQPDCRPFSIRLSVIAPATALALAWVAAPAVATDLTQFVREQSVAVVITGSPSHASYMPPKAFDGVFAVETGRWLASTVPAFVDYHLPADWETGKLVVLDSYCLVRPSPDSFGYVERMPTAFTLSGSNDGGETWTELDAQSGVNWSSASSNVYAIATPGNYRSYRFTALASNSSDTYKIGIAELRLFGTILPSSDLLLIRGEPSDLGTVDPGYGSTNGLAPGAEIACSASTAVVDGVHYGCLGYVLEDLVDGAWVNATTNLGATSFTYTHGENAGRLTWLWAADGYLLEVGPFAEGSGTVGLSPSPNLSDGCYSFDTSVTLTATPLGGRSFSWWFGDVLESQRGQNPVAVVMDRPRSAQAAFGSTWTMTPSSSTAGMMSDGDWALSVSIASATNLTITGVATNGSPLLNLQSPIVDSASGLPCNLYEIKGFSRNTNVTHLLLPNGLARIGTSAFSGCTALEQVVPLLPSSVTYIGQSAFDGCTSLSGRVVLGFGGAPVSFQYSGHFKGTAIEEAILGEGVTTSPSFQNCTSLTNLIWHDGITGCNTFSGCSKLVNVTPFMPKAIRSIGQQVFISTAITNDLEIGFGGVPVSFNGNLIFSGIKTKSIKLGPGVTYTADSMFYNCKELETVELPEGLVTLAAGTFVGCTLLKTVTPFLPASLTSIGNKAFSGCSALETPLSIIGTDTIYLRKADYNNQGMFTGCASIPSADLTGGITNIPGGMFYGCTKLGEIKLSEGILSFDGTETFKSCTSLTNVYFYGTAPTTTPTMFTGVTDYKVRVYVPRGDAGWAQFEADNVVRLTDPLRDQYLSVYPGETKMPLGVWTHSGKNLWFFYWSPPDSALRTTLLLVR